MPRVIHFEIPMDEPERAAKFYADVFGWQIQKWDGPQDYWMAKTGADGQTGINGALMKRTDFPNFASVINTIDVPSVDDFMRMVWEHGGKVVMPKTSIPGVGYFAYCQDTEGNTFGIMQDDPGVN